MVKTFEKLKFFEGAGKLPTADAVVRDLLDIYLNNKTVITKA